MVDAYHNHGLRGRMTDILYDDLLPSKVQLWGVLWKKPFGHNPYSSKWAKR